MLFSCKDIKLRENANGAKVIIFCIHFYWLETKLWYCVSTFTSEFRPRVVIFYAKTSVIIFWDLSRIFFYFFQKRASKYLLTQGKSILFYLLWSKKLNINGNVSLRRSKCFYLHFQRNDIKAVFLNNLSLNLYTFGNT